MEKTIVHVNEDGATRLRAISLLEEGLTQKEVAEMFDVHKSTIGEWHNMYLEGGAERLNTYRKPRPKYELDKEHIAEEIRNEKKTDRRRKLYTLYDLADGMKLKDVAKLHDFSQQIIMKWRRAFLDVPKVPRKLRISPHIAAMKIKQLENTKVKLLTNQYKRVGDVTKAKGIVVKLEKQLSQLQEIAEKYNGRL